MTMDGRTTPAAMLLLAASLSTVVHAADSERWTSTPTRQMDDTGKPGWPRIHITDPYLRDTAERMLDAAATALSHAECQMLMSAFVDDRGQPLSTRLADLGVTARDYLALIVFEDGTGRDPCKPDGVLAHTAPGSRVIYLCGRTFIRSAERDPKELRAVLIHEMLHSLGLGENPPPSSRITYLVRQRCWR